MYLKDDEDIILDLYGNGKKIKQIGEINQIHHKQKGEEKYDKNLRISQIHHKRKLKSQIHHKQKGEEKYDKNLRISQIHHKKKENNFKIICRISFIIFILTMVILNLVEISSGQTIYYVAKNGNDYNPGTATMPWLTLKRAVDTAAAGSTVYIKTGTYKEKLIPKNSGSIGNYITFSAYPGNTVTIDGTGIGVSNWNGLVTISGKSYINIIGLRIINSGWAGISVSSSHHINLKRNYIYKTGSSGILMSFGNNYIADGNEIILGNYDKTEQEILSIQSNVNIFEVKNNYLHSGYGIGIDAKNGASNGKIHHNRVYNIGSIGIYADAWDKYQSNLQIYSNRVSKSGTGIGLAGEIGGTLNNISIFNNIIYDNLGIGIRLPVANNYGYSHLNNIKIYNNVVYHNGFNYPYRQGGIVIGQLSQAYIYNLIVRNNIFSQNDYYQIKYIQNSKYSGVVIDRNLIYGYRGTGYEVKGTNYMEKDPLFMDTNLKDFRLKSTSSAIDKGSSNGAPKIDFNGVLRPKGIAYDIGSYEHIS